MDHPVAPDPELTDQPFILHAPEDQAGPLVLASAHSGRAYPGAFVAATRLDMAGLRRSEDSFVDELFADAPALGIPLLCATFPRAYCDPNREAWELDPAMFDGALPSWVNTTSARVSAGLGTIARVVATGETIYRGKLRFEEAERRVRRCWEPYHQALSDLLATTRQRFDKVLLIDCHSMPNAGAGGGPDFVLGDAHGTACAPQITRFVEEQLSIMGYTVRRNDPYAGGFITRHYGRPRERTHALQIEVARRLYMNEARVQKGPGFLAIREDLSRMLQLLTPNISALLQAS